MANYILSIRIGIGSFLFYAIFLSLPIVLLSLLRYKRINPMRISLIFLFILYSFCVLALVFLPLPTAAQAATLCKHRIQWIPFHFLSDILRTTPFEISNPHTYLPSILHKTVLQVVFNVLMTIPFGMFLRYYLGLDGRKIVLFSFLLSLFIELGQLTGLFFLYPGSYRLCDADDLIANTLGGYLGFRVIFLIERYLPSITAFDLAIPFRKKALTA
jgi:glycopeptide antibiotics resistance protein